MRFPWIPYWASIEFLWFVGWSSLDVLWIYTWASIGFLPTHFCNECLLCERKCVFVLFFCFCALLRISFVSARFFGEVFVQTFFCFHPACMRHTTMYDHQSRMITQPHPFTVLTTEETGRHRLSWRMNIVARINMFVLFVWKSNGNQ